MKRSEKHHYPLLLPKDNAGDGYYRYFQDIYSDAYNHYINGNRVRAFMLFHRGSRQYSALFYKGAKLSELIFDDCSLWLCTYYVRRGDQRKLNRILKRNFVPYNGNYYHLSTSKIVMRMVPNEELDPQYDFGLDVSQDEQTDKIVLEMIRKRRGA